MTNLVINNDQLKHFLIYEYERKRILGIDFSLKTCTWYNNSFGKLTPGVKRLQNGVHITKRGDWNKLVY